MIPLQWRRTDSDGTPCCACWRRGACGRRSCKHPLFDSWPEVATTDVELIRVWWRARPLANVGIATGYQPSDEYLIVIDEDKPGALAALAAEHGEVIPETWTQTTGRATGGQHRMFRVGDDLPVYAVDVIRNRTKLADGLDVRAAGGLIVAAPSVSLTGVTYTVTHDVAPAPVPAWLFSAIANRRSSRSRSGSSNLNINRPTEVELAARGWPLDRRVADGIERCRRHPAAIQGDRGDPTTWDLALQLVRGLVLPDSTAIDLLLRYYNPKCIPSWDRRDLAYKVDRAEDEQTETPWAYLLPPPRVGDRDGAPADEGGPHTVSPSVSSLPPQLPEPRPATISVATKPTHRAERSERATLVFFGTRRFNGKFALRARVLDGTHTGLEKNWWLDWPPTVCSRERWRHLAIALGLDREITDPLLDTHGRRVDAELVLRADGTVEIRRAFPLP